MDAFDADVLIYAAAPGHPLGEPVRELFSKPDIAAGRDHAIATLATALGSRDRLRAADASHLATAVSAGADRFITSNSFDFTTEITEVAIVTPLDLP